MSSDEFLRELVRWVSSDSILVIDSTNKLRRIYCPFEVIAIVNFPDIAQGQKVHVDAVKLTIEIKEVYIIKGKAYFIVFFRILPP